MGAVFAGVVLVALGLSLRQQIRKIKVPPLKWATTSLLFTYAVFWTGEALGDLGRPLWPSSVLGLPPDVLLLPLFLLALLVVRCLVQVRLALDRSPKAPTLHGKPL